MISRQDTARYLNLLRWFVRDSIGRYPGWVILISSTSFAGVFFQVSAISQVLYYAKLISSGQELALLGRTYDPRSSGELLVMAAGGIFLALTLAAGVTYLAQRTALRLSIRYERLCLRRCFAALGSVPPEGTAPFLLVHDPHNRIVKSDPRLAGRAFLKAMHTIVPAGVFFVATATLFYLDWQMTLLLIPLGIAGGYAIAKGNIRSARSYNDYESSVVPAIREKTLFLKTLMGSPTQREDVLRGVDASLENGPTNDQTSSYSRFMQTVDWNNCLNAVTLGGGFLLVLLVLGYDILHEQTGWGRLIVYLVGLRYAMDHLRQATSNLLAVNRFMPQIERLSSLLRHESVAGNRMPEPPEVRFLPAEAGDIASERSFTPPARVAVCTPLELDLLSLEWFHNTFLDMTAAEKEALRLHSAFLTRSRTLLPGTTMREAFGLPPDFTLEALDDQLDQFGFKHHALERFADVKALGLDAPLEQSQWKDFDRLAFMTLALVGQARRGKRVLHVDSRALAYLPRHGADVMGKLFRDTLVFVHYGPEATDLFPLREETALILGSSTILAKGTQGWCEENSEWILEQRRKAYTALARVLPGLMTENFDEMDVELDDI